MGFFKEDGNWSLKAIREVKCTHKATCCRVVPHKVQSKAVLTPGWGGTNKMITKQLLLYGSTDLSELKHYVLSSLETLVTGFCHLQGNLGFIYDSVL